MKKTIFLFLILHFIVHISNAQSISAGGYHSLFICNNNIPMGWGEGGFGKLGTPSDCTYPSYGTLTGIIAIAAGTDHSLFLKNDGTVWAAGHNQYGQLGIGTIDEDQHRTPVQVSGLTGIIAIAAGFHSLFLKNDGTVWACGYGIYGQLGNGADTSSGTPVQVSGLTGIIAISVAITSGFDHSLFLKNDSTDWACGANLYGELGDNTTLNSDTPVQVHGPGDVGFLTGIIAIEAGGGHSLFLKNDSTVCACGYNGYGQLGDGTTTSSHTPVQVNSLSGITAIAGGGNGNDDYSLFLKNDGTVWGCGYNGYGQMGTDTNLTIPIPTQLTNFSDITAIATENYHSLFLKNDGSLLACGLNGYGQVGDGTSGTNRYSPVQVIYLCVSTSVATQPSNSSKCSGTNTAFTIQVADSAAYYQWQESTNGGSSFSNLSEGGIYSGTLTAALTITGVTASMNNYQYRCIAGLCSTPSDTSNAAILYVDTAFTWTGTADIAWNNTANWNLGAVPDSCNAVIIPYTANNPSISTNDAKCKNITINSSSGAVLTITSAGVLTVED